VADSNFILANAGDADMQQAEQPTPMPQGPQIQQKNTIAPSGARPADSPAALRFPEQPPMEMPERWHDEDLMPFVEVYRRAAADVAQDIGGAATRFGKGIYEDTILRAGRELRQLAERFLDDPLETARSVLDSFPTTKLEGESLAAFAAAMTIVANAARGLEFERAVIAALKAAKNKDKIGVSGLGRSIPDILNQGITKIKSGLEIDSSLQLRVQATRARINGLPFNLVVNQTTQRVSQSVKNLVFRTGGTIQRFDLATGIFTPFQ
jgi:hypothetical protein